jgi:MATE family multidrug resistance protein
MKEGDGDGGGLKGVSDRLSHRDVTRIALPIILSNATVPLVGYVDTVVIGRYGGGAHLIGGVALAAVIFNNIYWIFGFLRMGTTGLTAQAAGAGDVAEIFANLVRALAVAALAGALLVAGQALLLDLFLWLMGGSDRVNGSVSTYFGVRIWGAPAALANFAIVGWFIGLGLARIAFIIQLILNGINIALAVILVFGFELGVAGVAAAILLAEIAAVIAGGLFAWRELSRRDARPQDARFLDGERIRTMIAVNRDVIIRTACLIFAFSFFAAQGARTGDLALAANAVLMSIAMIFVYMLDGFAFAAEVLVGQAVGAKRTDRFGDAIRLSTIWALVFAVAFSLILYFAGGLLIDFTSDEADVRAAARTYLGWAALIPVVGIWCYQLDGIFIGATGTRQMRNMAIVSVAGYLAVWAVLTPVFANHGLWAAILIFLGLRAVTLAAVLPALAREKFGDAAVWPAAGWRSGAA